jgi:RHS repeat-associated protein
VTYTYDLNSRQTLVQDATGAYGFTYDNMNRLTQTTTQYAFLTGQNFQNSYAYDAASNRKTLTAPDGSTNAYTYDALNRLATLTNSLTGQFGFGYDALSRRNSLTRPMGVNTTYTYDPVSNLLSVLHKLGTTILDGASYTYDPANNRKTRVDKRLSTTLTYGYDNIYELLSAKQGSTTKETYTYDLVGNRLSSLGVSPYSYNPSNELTSIPSASYTYDNNGNTLTKSGGTTYGWDFENRLVSAVVPGTGTVAFKYDPFGRRIQKSSASGTTNYLYDGANSIEEVDLTGNVVARYAHSPGIDEPLAQVASGSTSYYHGYGVGSITSLTAATGTIAATYTYDAFGGLITSTGSGTNTLRYTGREFDPETGIYFFRARYFDPLVGRFLSEDRIGNDEGSNLFIYVRNRPVQFRDPTGLYTLEGFDPQHAQLMRDAIQSAIDTLQRKQKDCKDGSAGSWGPKIIQALEAGHFVYHAEIPSRNVPGAKDCADAYPLNTKTINVSEAGFGKGCCRLDSTLAHEAMHKAQNSADEHSGGFGPLDMEDKCFNCR